MKTKHILESAADAVEKKHKMNIKIKRPGALHAKTHTKPGDKVPLAKEESMKANGTPLEKKEANFAINARKWHHGK
jgi:hypothetical protein